MVPKYECCSGDSSQGVNFSKPPCCYWNNVTKMSYLQRRIIIYSIMYYEQSESCVSDRYYDNISQQLVELMSQSTEKEMQATTYWYAMYDFDGSTGFDIPSRLTTKDKKYLEHLARWIHKQWKKSGGHIRL